MSVDISSLWTCNRTTASTRSEVKRQLSQGQPYVCVIATSLSHADADVAQATHARLGSSFQQRLHAPLQGVSRAGGVIHERRACLRQPVPRPWATLWLRRALTGALTRSAVALRLPRAL